MCVNDQYKLRLSLVMQIMSLVMQIRLLFILFLSIYTWNSGISVALEISVVTDFFFLFLQLKDGWLIMHLNKISRVPHDHLCLSLSWRSVCFAATAGGLALARCYATIDESQCVSIKNTFHCHMISHQKQWHGVAVCNGNPTPLYLVIINCHNSPCLPLKSPTWLS